MAMIAISSARGAPGVTTTALALTLVWPRPVLLVEADVSGSSSILAGYYSGRHRHDRGLIDLAGAHRAGRLTDGLREAALQISGTDVEDGKVRWFIPGLTNPAQAGTMTNLWEPMATALRAMDSTGVDVIVDAGRCGMTGAPTPLLREADLTLLTTRTDLPAIATTRVRAAALRDDLAARGTGEDALWMLLVGEGQPLGRRDAAKSVGLPLASTIHWDPTAAAVLSAGERPKTTKGMKKWQRGAYLKSIRAAVAELQTHVQERRSRLAPGPRVTEGGASHV